MLDRRKLKRKYLAFYTRVFEAGTRRLVGHLVDITPGGCMLISETPVRTGQVFQLKLELTADIAEASYLEFTAHSLWCREDVNPRFYNTGFDFVSITPEGVEVIQRIVDAYGFRDN